MPMRIWLRLAKEGLMELNSRSDLDNVCNTEWNKLSFYVRPLGPKIVT